MSLLSVFLVLGLAAAAATIAAATIAAAPVAAGASEPEPAGIAVTPMAPLAPFQSAAVQEDGDKGDDAQEAQGGLGVFAAGENQLTLLGPEIKVGQKAPGFTVSGAGLKPLSLADSAGKVRIIVSVVSLDTGVCSDETQKFNQIADSLPDNVQILTISMDLPFAQARWCGAHDVENVETASDFKSREFGDSYGVHIKESGLLSRAVFVVGKDDTVTHVEYVPQIAQLPDFAG